MAFMLARQAERHWRRLNGSEVIVHVLGRKRRSSYRSVAVYEIEVRPSLQDELGSRIGDRKSASATCWPGIKTLSQHRKSTPSFFHRGKRLRVGPSQDVMVSRVRRLRSRLWSAMVTRSEGLLKC